MIMLGVLLATGLNLRFREPQVMIPYLLWATVIACHLTLFNDGSTRQ